MLRTDNSATGRPTGYYGLFLAQDDVAKFANWLLERDLGVRWSNQKLIF